MMEHTVQFYEDERFLIKGLTDYIGDALAGSDVGIAIATEAHLQALAAGLRLRGLLDADDKALHGRFIPVDASKIVPMFIGEDDQLPDEEHFRLALINIIAGAADAHPGKLFVFGEIVALLCGENGDIFQGRPRHEAALNVEQFFNRLMQHFDFTLLCAYPLSAFPSAAQGPVFRAICDEHSMVLPTESYDPDGQRDALQRSIATLQQQAYALAREVRERREMERALHEVSIDFLTGLPNRTVFQDRLELDIKKAQRSGHPLALMFIDLDHFKEINDTRGHETGDLLLCQVAQRLRGYVRESDTVARLGGDEFTIILSDLHEVTAVTDIAQKIRADLSRPFLLGSELAYISASIGITIYPRDGASASLLLRNADQAMYRSKDRGRNRVTYFKSSMQQAAQSRMALSNELRRAMDEEQLEVHYQPIVDLADGRIRKAEALVRWHHPQRGQISPAEFIPIAEHTGLIAGIGSWVFHQARRQARYWRTLAPQLTINVNVSPAQFHQANGDNCAKWLHAEFGDGLPCAPEVGLEITEGLLLASNAEVLKQLMAFQQAGIKISLDDFGTGYSSLSYLRKFNLDFLKIDRSFVHNLEYD
ncbi:MAG: diguanylate cyclase, partial [Massilia sp.]|nr:diguanylate cyclase [Massilia sp.]